MKYEYDEEDKYVSFHEDDDELDTIRIPLPRLEEWYSHHLKREVTREEALTYVDGYGLDPRDQKFPYQETPEKIRLIYEVVFNKKHATNKSKYKEVGDVRLEDIYEEIESNQKYYAMEIEWMKLQIKRRYVGYWCFIKGKPTYLNGANYFFFLPLGALSMAAWSARIAALRVSTGSGSRYLGSGVSSSFTQGGRPMARAILARITGA